jgi:trehalose 6-phosphate synthase
MDYRETAAMAAIHPLPDSHPGGWLLMLDIDGTLLDIAHRPDAVSVPASLKETLLRLHEMLSGALVLISGRSVREIDTLFAPLRLAAVGLHGGEIRLTGERVHRQKPAGEVDIRTLTENARVFVRRFPGVLIEPKPLSVALHYRLNTQAGPEIIRWAETQAAALGHGWTALRGKQVCEIKPSAFDKGSIIRRLCAMRMYADRKPVYAGDDITDAPALAAIHELGGHAIGVGIQPPGDGFSYVETPAHMRRWLAELASRNGNHLQTQPLRRPGRRRSQIEDTRRVVVVSNRVTLPRSARGSTGGLAVAMSAVLHDHGGVWLGWSGRIAETPATRSIEQGATTFILRDISQQDYDRFYIQFCNATLWPVLHYNIGLTDFVWPAYDAYCQVNEHYAELLESVVKPDDYIWVHDFHFIPLAYYLRKRGVKNRIGFFLHTPFPSREVLLTLPVHKELMQRLMAYDLVGFQTQRDLDAFRDYAVSESILNHAEEGSPHNETVIAHFPIGIQTQQFAQLSRKSLATREAQDLKASLEGRQLILGVDRLDYSKGIVQRLKALEELLSSRPQLRKQFTFLQIAPPTREEIATYAQLRAEVESLVGHINGKHAMIDWVPIRFLARGIRRDLIASFYRLARICLVTPLRDGMNLVAKEFIAAQDPQDPGILILSRFAGAAEEFQQALLVNPYDIHEIASAIEQAFAMPLAERQERWRAMHDIISRQTLEKWYQDYLDALTGL